MQHCFKFLCVTINLHRNEVACKFYHVKPVCHLLALPKATSSSDSSNISQDEPFLYPKSNIFHHTYFPITELHIGHRIHTHISISIGNCNVALF